MGLNGDPVRISFFSSTNPITTSIALNLYKPGASTAYTLASNEIVVFESLKALINSTGSQVFIIAAPAGTASATAVVNPALVLFADNGAGSWVDFDTAALAGVPGMVPSVISIGTGSTWIIGTGSIVTYPGFTQLWAAKLTPGAGNF